MDITRELPKPKAGRRPAPLGREATDVELAWMAGFVEGDGHIGVHPAGTSRISNAVVKIGNHEKLYLDLFAEVFGGNINVAKRRRPSNLGPYSSPHYVWTATGSRALFVLKSLQPYLVAEGRLAAEILAQFPSSL